jgi:peroxiredoxin (alkyl hydroperoxide reductase subunit C)
MSVLVGRAAHDFTAPAVLADGSIENTYHFLDSTKGKYRLLFFYPLDFTLVCPTEMLAFDHRIDAFKKRNVEVVSVSVDSHFTHNAWRNTPVEKGGIGPVRFTMVADLTHRIARDYDVESPDGAIAFRGAFLIDKDGIVQHQVVNTPGLGRNVDELLRMVDALQFSETHGEVCPAGWKEGDPGMKASLDGMVEYMAEHGDKL